MASSAHFDDNELRCHGTGCCGGVNACTQALVDALESFRTVVGLPVIVDDAYRCPIHNKAVGGVPDSEHERGIAADIRVAGLTGVELYKIALRVSVFADGGIGVADDYVHVDTRVVKARWCYDAQGKWCEWNPALDAQAGVVT